MSTRCQVLQLGIGERLVTETCFSCGVLFAMVEDFYDHRRSDQKNFYCPNGHQQHYVGKSTAQKLKESQTREIALKDQLGAAVRDAEELRVVLVRERYRIANGVCPCCSRTFENVRRHMSSKHPDYDIAKVATSTPKRYHCSCGRAFDTPRGLRVHQTRLRGDDWDSPKTSQWRAHLTKV